MTKQDDVPTEEVQDLNRSRAAWAALASQPSRAHGDDADARATAERHGLLRSGDRLAGGGFADLDRESERIRREAPQRLAVVEAERRRQAEQRRRHAELAAQQPGQHVLADSGYGRPGPGWEDLVQRAHEALQGDARRDREGHRPEVIGGVDPDSLEEEQRQRQLGGGIG